MAKRYLTSIDLSKNQILNVAVHNLATAPSSPVYGQLYYNTISNKVFFYNGSIWVDMTGSIQTITGGAGLTASSIINNTVTLDLNVDNATVEINNDILRIKDLGITSAKINDGAITTIKLNNNAVTLAKLQQIGSYTALGNVTGIQSDVSQIVIVTDLASASSTTLSTSAAVKTYIDTTVGGIGNLEGSWDASSGTFPVGSSPVAGTKKGDYWYVTTAGTVGGVTFNIGDVIIAKTNAASTTLVSDWIQLEVNRDQATETVLGIIRLATQSELTAGTNDTAAVTPYKLKTYLNTYGSGNQTVTLSGAVTGTGTTAITTTLANGIVGISNLSATGTPSSSTYLRGDNTWVSIAAGGVTSFNTRTGAITLSSSDVTTALGFTPQGQLTLTTTGTSGSATLVGNTLNIPQYAAGGGSSTARTVQNFTATASQTTFTISGGYTVGQLDVFLNGVRLTAADYTASNGTTVVLGTGALVNDIVDVLFYTGLTGYISSTSISASTPLIYNAGAFSIQVANTSQSGYLTATDWNIFNGKQATITLTTTGSSGAATLVSNVLNVPTYTLAGLGGQASSTNLTSLSGLTYASASFVKMTASGTFSLDTNTYYLASNPSGYTNNTGTVTSVAALTLGTTGTDLSSSVATGTTTPVITLNIPTASASNRGALSSTDWSTFNGKQATLSGTGFVKSTAGVISYDTNTYLTANQSITLSGAITGTGSTAITTTLASSVVGIANLSATGTPSSTTYLRGDNTWATISGGGSFSGVLAAGTATTAPLEYTVAGSVLKTTPIAGDFEADTDGISYYSHADSSRGVMHAEQFISIGTTAYTLTSQTAAQKLFNTTTNGAVTVKAATTYYFECFYSLASMSGTTGSFGFALGGTATFTSLNWTSYAIKATTGTTAATVQTTFNTTAANTTIVSTSTQTGGSARITGTIRVNAGGTVIPQVSLGVAAAAIVGVNSYFRIIPIGTNTVTSVGNWS